MITYTVTVTRDSGAWFADVDGLPSNYVGATDVPYYRDLDLEVRDLIAGLTQTDPADFDIDLHVMFGDIDVTKKIGEIEHLTAVIEDAERHRDRLRYELIQEGRTANLPQSALADVLGVSQQRVAQLVHA